MASTPWQHPDDSGTPVNGQNQCCQALCKPFCTSYHTTESVDPQTILDVLRNGWRLEFVFNAEVESLLAGLLAEMAPKAVE